VKRTLIRTAGFDRALRRLLKRQPQSAKAVGAVLGALEQDAFELSLRTHKLRGDLQNAWACSAGYDLRVIFELGEREGAEVIFLLAVGTHDEVY
jgi:mRNA interferase YafQ